MPNQTAAVFAIQELLERILLPLPPRDLLLAQRVNKTFQEAVGSSILIQRKLFMRSDPARTRHGRHALNPFLQRVLGFDNHHSITFVIRRRNQHLQTVQVLDEDECADDFSNKVHTVRANHSLGLEVDHDMRGQRPSLQTLGVKSSWRKMLVADPPCVVSICDRINGRGLPDNHFYGWTIADSMGELMDVVDAPCDYEANEYSGW